MRKRREPTEKQLVALARAREALARKHTCERCDYYDSSHGLNSYRSRDDGGIWNVRRDDGIHRYCIECRHYFFWIDRRRQIEEGMKALIESGDRFALVDIESTGKPEYAGFQCVEIGIVDQGGSVLYQSLVRPDAAMQKKARELTGLTDEQLASAPSFAEIWPGVAEVLSSYPAYYAYNAPFDRKALLASAGRSGVVVSSDIADQDRWNCLMETFARHYGDYSFWQRRYRWKSLDFACEELGVERQGQHRAIGDALDALAVMKALARRGGTMPPPEDLPDPPLYFGE